MTEQGPLHARQPGFISVSLHRSLRRASHRQLRPMAETRSLAVGSKSPEFRKEWGHFYQLTDEIDPHLYEVALVMDSSQ
jgi:hypothetical protein